MKTYKCTINYTMEVEAEDEDEARENFYEYLQDEVSNIEPIELPDDNEPCEMHAVSDCVHCHSWAI